jgi:hypothetical protein
VETTRRRATSPRSPTRATISDQPGVDCFAGNRCTPTTQDCCVGLTGGGLIGQCGATGSCGPSVKPYFETWSCDKSFDCPATATKCCAGPEATSTLFGGLNGGGCPLQLHVSIDAGPGDAGNDPDAAPPIFTIASCQTSCANLQLCATDSECGDAGLHCLPVEFTQPPFSKTFGVCLP